MNLFHRHQWETIAAQDGEFSVGGGAGTWLLQKCRCGKLRVETLNGTWTLRQLQQGSRE